MLEQFVDVVDDDAAHRKLMRILVAEAGYEPRMHSAAESALEIARKDPPALVIADVQLRGGMDGVALTRALKATPETADSVVLFTTWARFTYSPSETPEPTIIRNVTV